LVRTSEDCLPTLIHTRELL